jgi:hypothetical protein
MTASTTQHRGSLVKASGRVELRGCPCIPSRSLVAWRPLWYPSADRPVHMPSLSRSHEGRCEPLDGRLTAHCTASFVGGCGILDNRIARRNMSFISSPARASSGLHQKPSKMEI